MKRSMPVLSFVIAGIVSGVGAPAAAALSERDAAEGATGTVQSYGVRTTQAAPGGFLARDLATPGRGGVFARTTFVNGHAHVNDRAGDR